MGQVSERPLMAGLQLLGGEYTGSSTFVCEAEKTT